MRLLAPGYYNEFRCIADRCKHSCCISWEIDIDEDTLEMYDSLKEGYGTKIAESIEREDVPHFLLSDSDRCPHLDCKGLCRIITELGDDYLCDICREHPRFYNSTAKGLEVGLGMSCEEACRIILSSDSYKEMIEIGEADTSCDVEFDALPYRDKIYAIISDRDIPYAERLSIIGKEFSVSPSLLTDSVWRDMISSIEYLDELHKEMFSLYTSELIVNEDDKNNKDNEETERMLERALAYFVYRHCTDVASYEDLRASVGLCLFLERLLAASVFEKYFSPINNILECARIISEEIEYSEDNTDCIKLEFSARLY